jgi:DNA-binding transcriptional activator of the SARP family
MPELSFHLFGKFSAHRNSQPLKGLDASKDQQLLSFLLLRRDQYHSREAVAAMFWGDQSTERSRKYLRQSLWHLQAALGSPQNGQSSYLLIEHDWLQVNPSNRPWCDVEEFEKAFRAAQGIFPTQLSEEQAKQLKDAAALYRDDLLTSWYQDWVLFERERLQNSYLLLLDKLSTYSELHHEYEQGQMYAGNILKYDPARERTHRQLMRLYYLFGDRTAALRQYERCVHALRRELGVSPERRTIDLHQQIKSDQFDPTKPCDPNTSETLATISEPVDLIGCLEQIQGMLSAVQQRIQRDLRTPEAQPRTHRKKL